MAFIGTLNSNEIFAALYNMILSQEVFVDNIADTNASIVELCRVGGGLYGDTKLYYATDVLPIHTWGGDSESTSLLSLERPASPSCQAVEIDTFKQIRTTLDEYLSKRAWMGENSFSQFNSVLIGWIGDSKRIYDASLVNTTVGTEITTTGSQNAKIVVGTEPATGEAEKESWHRQRAEKIAAAVADIMDQLADYSRLYNDYAYMRAYNRNDLVVVWNAEQVNQIAHVDVPTIFNSGDATPDKFAQYKLPSRFFGTVKIVSGTSDGTQRARVGKEFTDGTDTAFVFAGDLIPNGYAYAAGDAYDVDATVVCKIMHRRSMPFASAFEVGTDFFNPRSLTTTNYLTYGHNTLEHLKNYPFVTLKVSAS